MFGTRHIRRKSVNNMRKLNKKGMWAKNVAGWGGITSLAFGMIFIEHIGLATAITLEIIGCAGILFASFLQLISEGNQPQ